MNWFTAVRLIVASSRDAGAQFCKRTGWATLLARERYPDC
jgi:hypothetical protein